jgi:DNA-damage-inducible protein J
LIFELFGNMGYNVAQESYMPANAVVRARIDARVKEEATAIYAAAGLTLSDAFRMLLMRTVAHRALPFEPLMPNAETVEAMKAARRGELTTVGGIDNLLADLHADD